MIHMRYYIKCKLDAKQKQRLADAIKFETLARGKIFYQGMQTALREATIDENEIVHFVEICYCLEGGLYPMAMEIPVLRKYFDNILEVKDARLRNQCTMECEFCDCTRNIRLPGKSLLDKLDIKEEMQLAHDGYNNNYIDIGRLKLNRKKQIGGIEALRSIADKSHSTNLVPIFAGAAISGLFAIFYDNDEKDYFRVKNVHDTEESRQVLETFGLKVDDTVNSMKIAARSSLAKSDEWSNVI